MKSKKSQLFNKPLSVWDQLKDKRLPENTLVLIDGSSYLYRAFHGYPKDMTNGVIPTNAVYGFAYMLTALLRDFPTNRIATVFDPKGKTFRSSIYPNYKANRPPMPDTLIPQVDPLYEIIKAMGIPLILSEDVEADDVIGTLAVQASKLNIPVIIVTGDKDFAQLVDDNVILVNTMTNVVTDRNQVIEKFGVPPELIIDYLALTGDKADNIPGVPGVGNKTASNLLKSIGGLEALYQNLDKLQELEFRGSKTLGEKLSQNQDKAKLSYLLATIKTDVELQRTPQTIVKVPTDKTALSELYKTLGFSESLKP